MNTNEQRPFLPYDEAVVKFAGTWQGDRIKRFQHAKTRHEILFRVSVPYGDFRTGNLEMIPASIADQQVEIRRVLSSFSYYCTTLRDDPVFNELTAQAQSCIENQIRRTPRVLQMEPSQPDTLLALYKCLDDADTTIAVMAICDGMGTPGQWNPFRGVANLVRSTKAELTPSSSYASEFREAKKKEEETIHLVAGASSNESTTQSRLSP